MFSYNIFFRFDICNFLSFIFRDLARVLEPVVYLEITLESGDKQCIEVPLSKFHMLRQHVALLLKEIDIVKEKSLSIVRTVSS